MINIYIICLLYSIFNILLLLHNPLRQEPIKTSPLLSNPQENANILIVKQEIALKIAKGYKTMNDMIKHKIRDNIRQGGTTLKLVIFPILVGIIAGLCGTAFYFGMFHVTLLRGQNPWLIFLLPVGGLAIVFLYHILHDEKDTCNFCDSLQR